MEGHELIDALASMAVGVFGVGLIVCRLGWRKATQRVHELERQLERQIDDGYHGAGAVDATQVAERLDALTAQMERLGEGQDFLARIVADRERLPPAK